MAENEGRAQENRQRHASPHALLSTSVDQPLTQSIFSAPQPAASGHGFRFQSSVPSPDSRPSPSISFANPHIEGRSFSTGLAVMPHSPSDTTVSVGYPRRGPAILAPPHSGTSLDSALRRQSHNFLPSSALVIQPNPTMHGPDLQPIPGNSGQSASLTHQTSPTSFPVHSSLPQVASEHLNTPYSKFPGQYVVPTLPFQCQSSQAHVYYGYHSLGPIPYPPTQYYPVPHNEPQTYLQHSISSHARYPIYQQARHLPLPAPQFASGPGGSYHANPYESMRQYVPHTYGPSGQFSPVRPYQPHIRWHYPLDSSVFSEGDPTQVPRRHPRLRGERARRDSPLRAQPPSSQSILPPTTSLPVDPPSNVAPVTASRHGDLQEQTSVDSSQETNTYPVNQKLALSSTRPLVRRQYHPNPPPDRSHWVMWVGNVPNDATEGEFSDFLKQSSPGSSGSESNDIDDNGLMSVFLISRSNCAFANYRSEESLNRAISWFNGLKLRPHDRRCPKLVCRARRQEDDLLAGVGIQRGVGVHTHYVKNGLERQLESSVGGKVPLPKGRSSVHTKDGLEAAKDTGRVHGPPNRSPSSYASTSSSFLARHFPRRFFILKSLTRHDLDLSTDRGIWATQKHNEAILDQAYRTSRDVFLIYSANKSGEFYGYARMASGISRSNHAVSWAPRGDAPSTVPSLSTGRVPLHNASEQRVIPTRTQTLLPGGSQTSPSPHPLSSKEVDGLTSGVDPSPLGSAQAGQSASLIPEEGPPPPTDCPSDLNPPDMGTPVSPKSRGGDMAEPCLLPPVVEEVETEDDVQEGKPTQTTGISAMIQGYSESHGPGDSWGQTFRIEWLSTQRIQFHRTRHLRNPWNHDREIKVSRDGTELEPTVGQQLIDAWPTLANDPVKSDGRRTANFDGTSRRSVKNLPKPDSSMGFKGVKQGLS